MNWRWRYDNRGNEPTIAYEVLTSGARKYGTGDMLSIVYEYNRALLNDHTWHEKLANFGRIVFDFDIDKNTDTYKECIENYPLNDKYEPVGYTDAIESLIMQVFQSLGRESLVDILKMDKIKWFTHSFDNGNGSPWCWTSACRDSKISYHLTLPFLTCIETEGNQDGEKYYEGGNTLLIAMTEIYDKMIELSQYKCLLPDRNLLSKNHELRLPGLRKIGGDESTRLRFIRGHKIPYALSCIYPSFVPRDLYYLISPDVIDSNIPEHREYYDVDDTVYNLLSNDIKDMYPTYKMKKAGSTHICELIPKSRDTPCIVCCRAHDRSNPFICACGNRYKISCWRWDRDTDINGGSIPIGYIANVENTIERKREIAHRILKRAIHRYKHIKAKNTINTSNIDLSSYTDGDIYVKSAMGTGKTKALVPILNECSSYLMISNRRMQASKYKDTFSDTILYGEEGWTSCSVKRLIVQLESLHKVQRMRYDIIVLDEIESIKRLFISKTMSHKQIITINKLSSLISMSGKIIVLDAFLKQKTIKWLQRLRGYHTNHIIHNEFRHNPMEVFDYNSKEQWYAKLRDDKRRKVIVCLSKNTADNIYNSISTGTLSITSDTQDCIKNRDPHEYWHKYNNIIYTPTLSNSISFELEHFDVIYVYGCRGSASPEDLVQMCHRVRNIKSKEMHIYCSNAWYKKVYSDNDVLTKITDAIECDDYLPVSEESVIEDMRSDDILFNRCAHKTILSEIWNIANRDIRDLFVQAYTDRGISQRCFKEVLYHILQHELGYCIHMNTVYERKEKITKSTNTMIDIEDKKIFNCIIDEKNSRSDEIYNTLWRKRRSDDILRLSYMKRRDREYKHQKEGIEIYGYLSHLFNIGGEDIDKCIKDKKENVTLIFNKYNSEQAKQYITLIARAYDKNIARNKVWVDTFNLLSTHLFFNCKYVPSGTGDIRKYTYHIDMKDWLWYDIK